MNLIRAVTLPGGRLSRYFRSQKRSAAFFGKYSVFRQRQGGGGGERRRRGEGRGRRRRGEGRGSAAGGLTVGDLARIPKIQIIYYFFSLLGMMAPTG